MTHPNFLVIMSDEHDPRVSSPYGHPFVRTPAMQRLADNGVVFNNAYCNSPLCVPSRASFMTGKHLHRIGVWDNGVPLATDEPTWAHRLNALGYETALAGKMHFIGPDQRHGFVHLLHRDIHARADMRTTTWGAEPSVPRAGMRRRVEEAGPGDSGHQRYDDEVAERALAFLADPTRREHPWALCASFITPHFPLIAREPYFNLYYPDHADVPLIPPGHLEQQHPQSRRLRQYFSSDGFTEEEVRRARAAYYGLVTFCDERIGWLLEELDAQGLAENTAVIYVSDHGEMLGQHGMWWKCSFYEGSVRIPLIISWPGGIAPGRRFNSVTSLIDVVRTVLNLAGDDAADLDGANLLPLLAGSASDGDGLALAEYEGHGAVTPARMVRRGQFKLNYYHEEPAELFDLERDPDEFENLAASSDYAAIRSELLALALRDWDPDAISCRVRDSQHRRGIITRGDPLLVEEEMSRQ